MKRRNKIETPDLILTSDWHLREDTPICRTDDFWDAQWDKVEQIMGLQEGYNCPIIHPGDLFHHWKPSPWLLSKVIQSFNKGQFYTVYGNHDVPQHNMDLTYKSGINTLIGSGTIKILNPQSHLGSFDQGIGRADGFPFTIDKQRPRLYPNVGVWHKFVWDGKKIPWPDCNEMTALEVLKKYPEFDLIVTGDHHKPFTQEYKGRLLVNPGCLTRQAADYGDHRPRVYLWYADTNTVKEHYLEINKDAVSREHLEQREQSDKRIDAFVSRLSDEWETTISFDENLERFLSDNQVRKSVKKLVYKAIEDDV